MLTRLLIAQTQEISNTVVWDSLEITFWIFVDRQFTLISSYARIDNFSYAGATGERKTLWTDKAIEALKK